MKVSKQVPVPNIHRVYYILDSHFLDVLVKVSPEIYPSLPYIQRWLDYNIPTAKVVAVSQLIAFEIG